MGGNQWKRVPADICDELRSQKLIATDAIPSSGAAAEAFIAKALAKELFRRSEYCEAPVRLDGTEQPLSRMSRLADNCQLQF